MESEFKPGDIAILLRSITYPDLVGLQCRILTPLADFFVNGMGWVRGHMVEIPDAGLRGYPARVPEFNGWLVHPTQLRKPRTSDQPAAWTDCPWQPDDLRAAP